MNEDRYVEHLPPPDKKRVVRHDWYKAVAEARLMPNTWYLAFHRVPEGTAKIVRDRDANALRVPDGRWEVAMRNMRRGKGDLWIKFIPYTDEELLNVYRREDDQDAST